MENNGFEWLTEDICKEYQKRASLLDPADRKEAIHYALAKAEEDDVILIAGKGHENYQILKDKTIHFDDSEVVMEYWQK